MKYHKIIIVLNACKSDIKFPLSNDINVNLLLNMIYLNYSFYYKTAVINHFNKLYLISGYTKYFI